MLQHFEEMPSLLKFMTAHSLATLLLIIFSVVPHDSFSINGRPATYSELWSSGAGPFAMTLGIVFPIAGYMFLAKSKSARATYLLALILAMAGPYLAWGEFGLALFGITIVILAWVYLYSKGPSKYFCSKTSNH